MTSKVDCDLRLLAGSRALVTAVGELDVYTHRQLAQALDAAARCDADRLLIDLSRVTFIDSSALACLISEQHRRRHRIHIVISELRLQRIFEVTGYARVFAIHPTLEDAMSESEGPQKTRARKPRRCADERKEAS